MNCKHCFRNFVINIFIASPIIPSCLRRFILRIYGLRLGNCYISPRCFFGNNNIIIGDGSYINYDVFFDNMGKIEIGNNVHIGMGTCLCTSTHEIGNIQKRAGKSYGKDIKIGNGCWVGAKVLILPGVQISEGCIVGGGAVVTKDVPANSMVAGVPAKIIRILDN